MEIVLVANEKGGTGKSATVWCLANALIGLGYRVLAVDFDPSGNLSRSALEEEPKYVLYDVFHGDCALDDAIYHTEICDILPTVKDLALDIAPADTFLLSSKDNKSLTQFADQILGRAGAETFLRNLLRTKKHNLAARYDFVIIDSAPSDNLLVTNAIVAADSVLIPCEPSKGGLDGIWMMLSTIATSNNSYTYSNAKVDGIILSKYKEDGANDVESVKGIRETAELKDIYLYETALRNSKTIPHAMDHGNPILSYIKSSTGHGPVDALNLALEFLSARGLEPKVNFPGVQRRDVDPTKGFQCPLVYARPEKGNA